MRFLGCLTGIHPFSEELIQAIFDHKYGRSSFEPTREKFEEDLAKLIKLQQQLEFGLVTTGNLGWWDLFRPFVEHLKGIKPFKSLTDLPVARHPLTNTFYRRATIEGKIRAEEPIQTGKAKNPFLQEEITLRRFLPEKLKNKGWLAILPGPYHFKYASQGNYSPDEVILDFAEVLIAEIIALEKAGFSHVLLDESPLTWQQRTCQIPQPDHLNATQEALQMITRKTSAIVLVHTSNGDILWRPSGFAETILDLLLNSKVDGIGIDFLQTSILDIIHQSLAGVDLIAGLVDAAGYTRTPTGEIALEDTEDLVAQVRQLEQLEPRTLILGPTTRLEMIPRTIADLKLNVLGATLQRLRKEEN